MKYTYKLTNFERLPISDGSFVILLYFKSLLNIKQI